MEVNFKMESILTTIKKLLGITEDYEHFDTDIIVYINMALMTLHQLGVGPEQPASISNNGDTWQSTFGNVDDIEAVKTYIYLKVKMLFDPPSNSSVLEAMNRMVGELEWRLNVQIESKEE